MSQARMIVHGVIALAVLAFSGWLVANGGSQYTALVGGLSGAVVAHYFGLAAATLPTRTATVPVAAPVAAESVPAADPKGA